MDEFPEAVEYIRLLQFLQIIFQASVNQMQPVQL